MTAESADRHAQYSIATVVPHYSSHGLQQRRSGRRNLEAQDCCCCIVAPSQNAGPQSISLLLLPHTSIAPPRLSSHRYKNKLSTCNLISSQPMSSDELSRALPLFFHSIHTARKVDHVQTCCATWSALICPTHVSWCACSRATRKCVHIVSYCRLSALDMHSHQRIRSTTAESSHAVR
jgi:hypothetical protein